MSDLTSKTSKFKLPVYINIPFFLYQDNRLEKAATLIAAFFYSLHTAGQEITASTDYLCLLAGIQKRQFYKIMNQLEDYKYITRTGFTNRKTIKWTHTPQSKITVQELDTSALQDTSVQALDTSALQCTKLVHSSTLNLCTPVHTDIKEDTKDYKKLTTVNPNPSSSSFFSENQKEELLSYKLSADPRTDELFLEHCVWHVEKQENDKSKFQRFTGLKHILVKVYETKEPFKATGFNKKIEQQQQRNTPPTQEDIENYKNCVSGYEWVGVYRRQA